MPHPPPWSRLAEGKKSSATYKRYRSRGNVGSPTEKEGLKRSARQMKADVIGFRKLSSSSKSLQQWVGFELRRVDGARPLDHVRYTNIVKNLTHIWVNSWIPVNVINPVRRHNGRGLRNATIDGNAQQSTIQNNNHSSQGQNNKQMNKTKYWKKKHSAIVY